MRRLSPAPARRFLSSSYERLVTWALLAPTVLFAIVNRAFDWWRERIGELLVGEPVTIANQPVLRQFTLLRRVEVLVNLLELGAIVWLVYLSVRPFWPRATSDVPHSWRTTAAQRLPFLASALFLGALVARSLGSPDACALLFATALSCLGFTLLARLPAPHAAWLAPPVLVAWALRLASALALHVFAVRTTGRPVLFDDESSYDFAARLVLHYDFDPNVGDGFLPTVFAHLPGQFLSFVTGIYAAVAPTPLAGRLLDALIGTCAVALGALIAYRLFGRIPARITAYLLACTPGLVVWSGGVLKEALASVLLMALIWGAYCWFQQPRWRHIALVAAILHVFASVRLYVPFAAAGLLAPLVWHVGRTRRLRPAGHRVLALPLAAVACLGVLLWLLSTPSFQPQVLLVKQTNMRLLPPPYDLLGDVALDAERAPTLGGPVVLAPSGHGAAPAPGMLLAASPPGTLLGGWHTAWVATRDGEVVRVTPDQVRPLMSVSYTDALRYLGQDFFQGLATTLFTPLVGDVHASRIPAPFLYLDLAWWLATLALAALGARAAVRASPLSWGVIGFVALALLVLAIVPGNPGNLVRQRAVVLAQPLLLLAGPGLLVLSRWASGIVTPRRASSRAQQHIA